jgi:hypothetical protein
VCSNAEPDTSMTQLLANHVLEDASNAREPLPTALRVLRTRFVM